MRMWDTILIVGGPDSERPLLRDIFSEEYNVLEADAVEQAILLLEQNRKCIVGVIMCRPPIEPDGQSFFQEVKTHGLSGLVPLLAIVTPTGTGYMEEMAFSLGAFDVIPRPVIQSVIKRRVHIMVDHYRKQQEMALALEAQAESIRHTNEVMVDALASIIEYRSAGSGSHILRIRRFSEILLHELAKTCPEYGLTEDTVKIISSAAALHDIGKISIPDRILNKPAALTEEERAVMQTHTVKGADIIAILSGVASEEYLRYAYNICRFHHERWDGKGYPDGLSGEDIPICAQVVAVADAFDALTNDRVYKEKVAPKTAINMILAGECGEFSPKLYACFSHSAKALIRLANEYSGGRNPHNDAITLPLPRPDYSKIAGTSLDDVQKKYQALLHHLQATVIETDFTSGSFQIIYNPFPNFKPISQSLFQDETLDLNTISNIHPEDVEKTKKEYHFLRDGFFREGLRKHSLTTRFWSSAIGDYRTYEVTFIRLDPKENNRKALLIWQPISQIPIPPQMSVSMGNRVVLENKAMLMMTSCMICRKYDKQYTFVNGTSKLADLLGYSEKEIESLCKNRFINLIIPEDQNRYRSHVTEKLRTNIRVESEYRMRHKDGRILWIMERGCVLTGEDGEEYFFGALWDDSRNHIAKKELEEALWSNSVITEKTNSVVVDWRLEEDKIGLSENFEKLFGYKPDAMVLSGNKLKGASVHPDDLPVLEKLIQHIRNGGVPSDVDIRLVGQDKQYVFCRLCLSNLKDAEGIPRRVLGVLTNIDKEKRAYANLKSQSEQDSLTGLLNQAATHTAIKEYLRENNSGALFMIDLDNFKGINDRFGHLFGNVVLTRVSQHIRRLFRSEDIIGRVGGDEFMIFMKGGTEERLVTDRCRILLDKLSEMFSKDFPDCVVSCSIGIAFAPKHGTSFQVLFNHADRALYRAKEKGKGCYAVYYTGMQIKGLLHPTPVDAAITGGVNSNRLMRTVLRQFMNSTDIEKTIEDVMAIVGRLTNVSRMYIFENNDENTHCSNTFEWCNEGIRPEKENLQNICYETDLPDWESNYDENDILFCTDIAQLSPFVRSILEPLGIKSMLHCAIRENGVFRGYLGLDENSINRIWTQEEMDILVFLAEVVASFLLKKRAQDKVEASRKNLQQILEKQRMAACVVDAETHKIAFVNENAKHMYSHIEEGDICYKTFAKSENPCEDCPMKDFRENGGAIHCPIQEETNSTVPMEVTKILWNDKPAALFHRYDERKENGR